MTPPPDLATLTAAEKDALIAALLSRIDALTVRVAALEAENKALREKVDLPPKTPRNSSTPPSQGHKANAQTTARPKGKAHAGTHRRMRERIGRCIPIRRSAGTYLPRCVVIAKPR